MTKRLKAYIKRTVLASAREYGATTKEARKEARYSAFRDYAHGTDTGTWSDLIYTVDVFNMFNRYRSDVAAAIADYLDNAGESASARPHINFADADFTYADMLVACTKKRTVQAYHNDDKLADAAQYAIRFACEYLLNEVASECGVDL